MKILESLYYILIFSQDIRFTKIVPLIAIIIKQWPSVVTKLDILDILKEEIEKTNTYNMKFKHDTNKKLEHKTVCERHKMKSYTKE